MSKLARKTDQQFQDEAFTRQFCMDKLAHWRELLLQHDEGLTNKTLTRAEILRSLNTWLDELAAVAEIRWLPSTEREKRIMGWRN